jgi:ABC-type uncharacterized transport system substrate-binding protein
MARRQTSPACRFEKLRDELQKLGWIEGRNLRRDFRFANGDANQTGVFAADLVRLASDVIVPVYAVDFVAVQQQTNTIPIVFIGPGDPVQTGQVRNPARPEGNATGFANVFGSLGGKWLELLKEIAANITRAAHVYRGAPGSVCHRSEPRAITRRASRCDTDRDVDARWGDSSPRCRRHEDGD